MDQFSKLPPEIMELIFHVDNFNNGNWRSHTYSTAGRIAGRSTDRSISLVSQRFVGYGNRLLYGTIVMFNRFTSAYVYDDDMKLRESLESPRLSELVTSLTFDSYHMATRDAYTSYESSPNALRQHLSPFQWDKLQHSLLGSCNSLRQIKLQGYVGANISLFIQHLRLIPTSIIDLEWTAGPLIPTLAFPFDLFIEILHTFTRLQHLSVINSRDLLLQLPDIAPPPPPPIQPLAQLNLKSFTLSTSPTWLFSLLNLINPNTLTELNYHGQLNPIFSKFLLKSNFVHLRHFRISLGDHITPELAKKSKAAFLDLLEFLPTLYQLTTLEIRSAKPYYTDVIIYLLSILPMSLKVLRISAAGDTWQVAGFACFAFYKARKLGKGSVFEEIYLNSPGTPPDPPGLDVVWEAWSNLFKGTFSNFAFSSTLFIFFGMALTLFFTLLS